MTGIYTITNITNDKMYVGYASDIDKRFSCHITLLRYGKHDNEHLQRAYGLYGEGIFLFEPLVECKLEHLASEEHYWATMLNVHDRKYGYNKQATHPEDKCIMSNETKELLRIANTGRVFDENWRSNIAKSARNRKGQSYGNRISISAYNKDGSLYIKFDSFRNALRHFTRPSNQYWLLSRAIKSKRLILEKYWKDNTNDTYYLPHQLKKKRKPISNEMRLKMSLSRIGHKQSVEQVEKRMLKIRGVKKPEGFGEKVSARTSKKVKCTDMITGNVQIIKSVKETAIVIGVSYSTIITQLKLGNIWRQKYKLEYYEN